MDRRIRNGWRSGLVLGFALLLAKPIWGAESEPNVQVSSGKDLFMHYCASCHGEKGEGDGPAAAALKNSPADLTKLSLTHSGQFPRTEVIRFIDGEHPVPAHGPRHMPVWGEVFRESSDSVARMRIHSLTTFIESLQKK